MTPSGAAQDEAIRFLIYDECRTIQMRARQGAPNFQLFTYDDVIAFAEDLQPIDPARRSAREWLQVANRTQVCADPRPDEIGELLATVRDAPSIEIARLLIESEKDA